MKIYLASSWKMAPAINELAKTIRLWGHEVDSFCEETPDRYSFHFSEVPNYDKMNAVQFLEDERAQRAFREDKKWLDWADAVIMIKPCGNSAHLEAGYAKGTGKKLYILGGFNIGDYDVMYGFADGMYSYPRELQKLKRELLS